MNVRSYVRYCSRACRHTGRVPTSTCSHEPGPDRLLKRLIASVLLLSFGLFSLELLIADVHDGDAPAAEVASAPNVAAAAHGATDGDADAPVPGSGHSAHACHCVHVHGFFATAVAALPNIPGPDFAITRDVARTPDQVERDVHLRPPIA